MTSHGSSHPLYQDYRLALAAQDEERALQAIRALARLDPNDAGARAEAVRLENKILERKIAELRAALTQRNKPAIYKLLADLHHHADALGAVPGYTEPSPGRPEYSPLPPVSPGDHRPPGREPISADPFAVPAPPRHDFWWILGGAVIVIAVLTFVAFQFAIPYVRQQQAAMEDRAAIERILGETGYFSGPRAIPKMHLELSVMSRSDLARLRGLVVLSERILDALRAANFSDMRGAVAAYQADRNNGAAQGLDILPRLDEVADKAQAAAELEAGLSTYIAKEQAFAAFESLQQKAVAVDQGFDDNVKDEAAVKARLDHLANEKLVHGLRVLLLGQAKPAQDPPWFESALGKIKLAPDEQEIKATLDSLRLTVADWIFVQNQPPNTPTTDLQARVNAQAAHATWPAWLRELAAAELAGTAPSPPGATPAPPGAPPGASPAPPPQDTPGATPGVATPPHPATVAPALPLYFVTGGSHFTVALPATTGADFTWFLRAAGKPDEALQPFSGDPSRGLGPFGEYFRVRNGVLSEAARPPAPPYVVVGKQAGAESVRVYVGPTSGDKPVLGTVDGGLSREADDLVVDLSRLPGRISQPLSLRLPPGFGVPGSRLTTVDLRAGRAGIGPTVAEMKELLQKLSANLPAGGTASADADESEIRAEVRRLSERPKDKEEKKPGTPKPLLPRTVVTPTGDVPADIGLKRPAEMLAALFEKYWPVQIGGNSNPADRIRVELAKKPEQADWPGLLVSLKADFHYATADWLGKSEFDKRLAWAQSAEKLAERVCAVEARQQTAQGNAAQSQARATQLAGQAKALEAHPLLHNQIPPGTYTLQVTDGDRKYPIIDFKMP